MLYNKGDIVTVKLDLIGDCSYCGLYCHPNMTRYNGYSFTIEFIGDFQGFTAYHFKNTEKFPEVSRWLWVDTMLEDNSKCENCFMVNTCDKRKCIKNEV